MGHKTMSYQELQRLVDFCTNPVVEFLRDDFLPVFFVVCGIVIFILLCWNLHQYNKNRKWPYENPYYPDGTKKSLVEIEREYNDYLYRTGQAYQRKLEEKWAEEEKDKKYKHNWPD